MTETKCFPALAARNFTDPLTERAVLAQAVEVRALSCHADKLSSLPDVGRRLLVRHGHLPEREVMTGIGPVAVRCPRVRGRGRLR